jgi:EmrB/QacA subfamily drug resistance transporter
MSVGSMNAGGHDEATRVAASGALFRALFSSIALPMFLAIVDQTIVAAALPSMAATLGDVERVSWVVVGYLVAATIAAPVYGRLGDVFGRRRMMFIALGVFAVASILCALANSMLMLIICRVLQGLGGGGLMTTSQALIGETVPPRDRPRYQGYMATIVVVSSMFGPVAGGFLTHAFGWRSIFLVNLPLVLLAVWLARRLPVRSIVRETRFRFDFAGLCLFVMLVVSLLLALSELPHHRFSISLWLLAAGSAAWLALLALLIRHESRTAQPLIPVKLLRRRAIWRADMLATCHGAALVSLITYLPIYFVVARGTTPAETGLLLLPLTASLGIGSMLTGKLVAASGRVAIVPTIGLILATASLVTLAVTAHWLTPIELSALLGLVTFFMGSVMAVVQLTVQSAVEPNSVGAAAASVQLFRTMGSALGTAIVGAVLFAVLAATDIRTAEHFTRIVEHGPAAFETIAAAERLVLRDAITDAFRIAFSTIAVFTATGIVLAWSNPLRRL